MRKFKDQFGTTCFDKDDRLDICPEDSSIIVAILSAGTVIGALLAAPLGDSIGRRHASHFCWNILHWRHLPGLRGGHSHDAGWEVGKFEQHALQTHTDDAVGCWLA